MTVSQFRLFARVAPWLLVALAAGTAVRIGLSVDQGLAALSDTRIYHAGVLAWLDGKDFYNIVLSSEAHPGTYTYPPFSLLPFGLVLGWYQLGAFVFTAGSVAALFHILVLVLARAWPVLPHRPLIAAAGTVCAVQLEPLIHTFYWGQVNVFLLWLVALDCLHRNPRWPRGVLVGVAAAIKLTPLVFVLFFLLGRQVRPALVAVAGFAACTGLAWAIAPHESTFYWTRAVWDPARIGNVALPGNQSLRGFAARLVPPPDAMLLWAALAATAAALAAVVIVRFRRDGGDVPAWLATAALGTLVSPVSWTHHWVWFAPLLLVTAVWAGRAPRLAVPALVVVGAVAVFAPAELFPASPGAPWWTHLLGESYVVAGFLMLVGLAVLPRRLLPSGQRVPDTPEWWTDPGDRTRAEPVPAGRDGT
ncbi:glycosyltransferase 87 family protein [Amycolatopsis mediterranei]|uniref:glycosyltransferase 87 family protein n=1 Tax=Amycolatopsis mediterranei TaxID=33910 RepID=UPI0003F7C444|nr:glycosyltransferase 87 family protein [Amycolatopsis mediterranei]UZF69080.1 glycosyltransferase 87 family protein [Amycolatopsis mediterranei]